MSFDEFLDRAEKRVDRLARRGILDNKKIVLFGATVIDGRCKRWLEDRGYTVEAIIDNSRDKNGREYLGLTVRSPAEVLLPFDRDRVILIMSPTYASEMTYQLVQMGYSSRNQVFSVGVGFEMPWWWVSMMRLTRAARGSIVLRRLSRGPEGKRTVFLTPVPPAGDVYVECLFVREYARRHHLRHFVIAVPNAACRRVAQLFGFQDVVLVGEDTLWRVLDYARLARLGPDAVVSMHYPLLNSSVALVQGFKGLNFERMFRYGSFDLGDDVAHDLPATPPNREAAEATLAAHGLRPGRTVVLAPYANSLVHGHAEQFWSSLARELGVRGYDVCTSGFGPLEPAVAGTTLLAFPFAEALAIVESAGAFVGLRSGLCDVISPAKAVKVILHERGTWYKTSLLDMFSLNAMGLCDDAIEFEVASSEMESVLHDVLEVLA